MVISNTYVRLLKATGCGVFTTGGLWVSFQIHKAYHVLDHVVNVNVLEIEKKRAEYIYIHDPYFKDETCFIHGNTEVQKSTIGVFDLPMRWWKSWKHSYAWRLLSMAQNGDRSDHLRAVRMLASLNILTDSDKRQLAQVCDERTAIGLARTEGVDLRFFHPPPDKHVVPTKEQLMKSSHMLLNDLNKEKQHHCIRYFLKKAFPNLREKHLNFLDDLTSTEVHKGLIRDEDILPLCVENILHHSTIEENAKDIVKLGGLPILMGLCRYFEKDTGVLIMLGKIISNISVYKEMLPDIFKSGWVGVLAKWSQNPDVRVSSPAARALANLDDDDRLQGSYWRRIYLLHPTCRTLETTRMDVVFVHGLLGGVFVTWRQRDPDPGTLDLSERDVAEHSISDGKTRAYLKDLEEVKRQEWDQLMQEYEVVMTDCPEDASREARGPFTYSGENRACKECKTDKEFYSQCWPKDWLPNDCRCLRIIGINYDTNISDWTSMCPADRFKGSLEDRSDELLRKLKLAGVGSRPIVWVSHSMGGLLVKNMLVKAWQSGDEAARNLCHNTRAIAFYSVPHRGSPLAALTQATTLLVWPSVEVQELRENSPALASLHEKFLNMLAKVPIEVVSFAETKPTKISSLPSLHFNFVPLTSANPGVGDFFAIPQDHLCICKPASRQSFLYQKVLQLILDCNASSQP